MAVAHHRHAVVVGVETTRIVPSGIKTWYDVLLFVEDLHVLVNFKSAEGN